MPRQRRSAGPRRTRPVAGRSDPQRIDPPERPARREPRQCTPSSQPLSEDLQPVTSIHPRLAWPASFAKGKARTPRALRRRSRNPAALSSPLAIWVLNWSAEPVAAVTTRSDQDWAADRLGEGNDGM